MSYLQDKKQKGFVHILSVLLLVGGLVASVYLVQQRQIFRPKAAGEAILTASCPEQTNIPYLGASWNLPAGSGYNIYIRAGSNDYQVGNSQTGIWSGTQLPNGPTIVNGGSYILFASNGTNTYSDGPKTVSCNTNPSPTPVSRWVTIDTYCLFSGIPSLNATWYLDPSPGYNIYIRAGTSDYQIGTTQIGVWSGTRLPNGPEIVTGGTYTVFGSNGTTTSSAGPYTVPTCPTPIPIPTLPPDFGTVSLQSGCPDNDPSLYASWDVHTSSTPVVYVWADKIRTKCVISTTTRTSNGWLRLNSQSFYTICGIASGLQAGLHYTLFAENNDYKLSASTMLSCYTRPGITPCSVGWALSNSSPAPNTNITVKVRGISDSGGWQNIDLMKDGSANGVTWRGITNPWPTFNYTVNSGAAGTHTLSFKTNNGTKTCTPTVSFTTVNPKQPWQWWK